jgi:hypothetical protein
MRDAIYLINERNEAVQMTPAAYAKEEEFQDILERFPELLAGEQVDREFPRRWLLVAREMGIPDSESMGSRWQVDHFFVDQDGIPTFVEVKRQSDTRARREVVSQMLDYAANAKKFWQAQTLRNQFEKTCQKNERDPDQTLGTFLGSEGLDPAGFWDVVHGKLLDGELRLLFIADQVPAELQSIVEFLNNQMTKTEVLAIEVTRYLGGGFSTHIPRLVGQTADAIQTKAPARASTRRKWDEKQFFAAAETQPASVQDALRKLCVLAKSDGFDFRWGTGSTFGSLNIIVPSVCPRSVVSVQTNGVLKPNFGWLPDETRESLGSFARVALALSLEGGWQQTYPEVAAESWVPAVEAILSFLKSLKPAVTAS